MTECDITELNSTLLQHQTGSDFVSVVHKAKYLKGPNIKDGGHLGRV